MNRKLFQIGTIAAIGFAAVVAGVGDAARAVACDENAKAARAAKASSCSEKATTASAGAGRVHDAMIKSAVVAPGSAPILSAAAFGAAMTASDGWCPACEWCPERGAANAAAAASLSSCIKDASAVTAAAGGGCAEKSAVKTAALYTSSGCAAKTAAVHAASGCAGKSAATTAFAAGTGCEKSAAAATVAAGEKSAISAGGEACCKEAGKAAAAASKDDGKAVCDESKTAKAFKASVDEIPYRENKRVVLAGSYACAHCTLHVTEECVPLFKTADGKVYPLIKNAQASDLRKADQGNGVEIASSVKKIDGVKYLEVKSHKTL